MLCTQAQNNNASSEQLNLMASRQQQTNGSVRARGSLRLGSLRQRALGLTDRGHLRPALGHIDFWPSCTARALKASEAVFEQFDVLVERANRWLQQFSDFELVSCETADKKVLNVQDIYSASMLYQDEEGQTPMATHIKGLRLWYRQRKKTSTAPKPEPLDLQFMDFVPQYLNPAEKHPRFETLPAVIDQINSYLRESPLPGKVLSVETVALKISENEWDNTYRINSMVCQCYDDYFTHQVAFIRVFYAAGPPAYELIGVHDFTPDILDEGGLFHPALYSSFTSLIDKARAWVSSSRGLRITSFQTLDTKHRKKSENHGHRFNTEKMFEYKIENRFRAYFVRVGYTRPMDGSLNMTFPVPDLACRTYKPLLKRGIQYENVTETLEKVEACINCTGAKPFHIETIPIPEWMTRSEFSEKGERTFFDGEWYFVSDKDGNPHGPYRHSVLYVIRIYFDGQFEDPAFMRSHSIQAPDDSCCCLM